MVSNAMGASGAWVADFLIGFFGQATGLIPFLCLIEASMIWWPRSYVSPMFRRIGYVFLLTIVAVICFIFIDQPTDAMSNASGGIVGFEIGRSLVNVIGVIYATISLGVMIFLLATLCFGIRWLQMIRSVWQWPVALKEMLGYSTQKTIQKAPVKPVAVEAAEPQTIDPPTEFDSQNFGLNDFESHSTALEQAVAKHEHPHEVSQQTATDDFLRGFGMADETKISIPNLPIHPTLETEVPAMIRLATEQAEYVAPESISQPVPDEIPEHTSWLAQHRDWKAKNQAAEVQPPVSAEAEKPAVPLEEPPEADVFDRLFQSLGSSTSHAPPKVNPPPVESVSSSFTGLDVFERAVSSLDKASAKPAVPVTFESLQADFVKVDSPSLVTVDLVEETSAVANDFEEDSVEDDVLVDANGRRISHSFATVEKRKDLSPLPSMDLLDRPDPHRKVSYSADELRSLAQLLEIKLKEFNIKAEVVDAQPGPVVTRFELDLAAGIKASKVTGIARDLARSLSMASVRVVEVIPGKPYIGIEIPNVRREMVRLIELLETNEYRDPKALISMAMGKDIAGRPVLTDLAKAPHMLVAGTTGSGKSVAVNAMLLSMLLKYTPLQLRLILIDPKQLELSNYNGIPHLLTPVVTDMKDAASSLNWCVGEMERRYKLLSIFKVRNADAFNQKVEEAIANGEELIDPTWKVDDYAIQQTAPRLKPLPMIVVVADEFADMIMQVGKKSEDLIQRLAQKSRAAGIHLILATQRPSVDVITGLIKANIPTRVALRVNSKIDSRTILDEGGAEYLLGHGDMLFLGPGKNEPERVHGAFISDDEVNKVCDAWRERGSPDYVDEILTPYDDDTEKGQGRLLEDGGAARDAMFDQVVSFVLETRKVSASAIQRKFSLGFNRAARLVDQMEEAGIISPMGANDEGGMAQSFDAIYQRALKRKGGEAVLNQLMPTILSPTELANIGDDRYLSMMTKGINQAGFHWQVIENKWPQFEEAFYGFDVERLAHLPDEAWENYLADARVVRNWQKISALKENVMFVRQLAQTHGSAGRFFADWPQDDQFGLLQYLKKHGSRLGGMTGAFFLRRMGKDVYLLSADVCVALQQAGLDIPQNPTSQKDLKAIGQLFNQWHQQTQLPYSHLSKIAAYSVGENYDADYILEKMGQDES
ncbi:unnamed protein product [Rotaria magnacalcarata]|nr:unnamed protein product [Rotaria magnacalcarata]